MKMMIPFMAGTAIGLGLWAYTTNKKEIKKMLQKISNTSETMMKQFKETMSK